MPRRLLAALFVALFAAVGHAQKSPEDTVKSMTVADGLQVELFAAEPMVLNPTSIDVDHRGRVWVCEAVNYRRVGFKRPILREAGDRIVILTDTDGDGKADDSTVFYQAPDLYGPLGVCVLAQPSKEAKGGFAYRVIVCQSPDILEFWDRDGDGKADGPPKKFLTNFGGFDHDHGVHGINVGPDGKLYFTVGDSGVKGLQSSDGKGRKWESNNTDVQKGTVWRCNQDGTALELIAHNFRNNYECCVNSFGEIWLSDNDDDGNQQTRICHVMPGGNYGYGPRGPGQTHWHEEQPGIVHKTMRTGFGSPTGICFYEGTLLPERFRGQLLHTDAGPRELRAFHIKPLGAGYSLTKENLVTSTDTWFRLSDVCVAPDGSLMLADWYDPGVGGHGMGDWTRGRIYRVTPKGHKGYKVPAMKLETHEESLTSITSPCLATRHVAIQHLRSLKTTQLMRLVPAPEGLTESQLTRIVHALLTWEPFALADPKDVKGLSKDEAAQQEAYGGQLLKPIVENPRGFAFFIRLCGTFPQYRSMVFDDRRPKALVREIAQLPLRDAQREVMLLMRSLDVADAKGWFYDYAKLYDGQDHFYRAALNIACGTDPERRKAILADFDKHFPEWNDKVADLAWELRPASVLPRLSNLLADAKLTPAQKGRVVDILAVYDEADAGQRLLALLGREVDPEIKRRAVENLATFLPTKWKDLKKGEPLRETISRFLKSADQISGLKLAAAAPDCTQQHELEELAKDAKAAVEVRTQAVRVIGKIHHVKYFHTLEEMIADPVIGTTAIVTMGDFVAEQGDNSGAKQALALLRKLLADPKPEVRSAALSGLVATRQGTGAVLQMKEKNELPDAVASEAGKLLRNSPFQGERNKAMQLFPAAARLDIKKLPSPAVLAKRTGDPKRGQQVLAASLKGEAQCLRCHTVNGVGGNIGPDQSMIGKKASKENLFESILQPSKAIADQYVQWKVNTQDGKTVTGLLVAETEASLTLRDANGKDYTFATKDLDGPKQKSLVSIMPDNLAAALTEDELIDLVEYMLTLKTPSLSPDAWHIVGPFPNDASDSALDRDLGLEKHPAIDTAKPLDGKDGPVKWATVRPTATGYIDLAAHHGAKSPHSASYLYQTIESPADQDGVILFGNDDGAKVWVNGAKVFENRDHLAAEPGRHRIPVKLKKGSNAVLIKIVNGDNPHGLYFALTSEQELKVGK